MFPIQHGLNEKCFITIDLKYAIRKAQESWVGHKLNGTHQLLVSADTNLLGESTTKKTQN
jgi:hypothetical protein